MGASIRPQVAVIGAGAAGLAAAFRLQRAGLRVRLFERGARVGGKMKTTQRDGFMLEEGPSAMAGSYRSILGIAEDAGMGPEIIPASSLIGFAATDGKLHYLDATRIVRDGLQTGLVSVGAKLRMSRIVPDLLRTRALRRPDDLSLLREFDGLSAEAYSRERFGDEITDYLIDPCVRSFVNCASAEISACDLLYVLGSFLLNSRYVAFRQGMSSYAQRIAGFCDLRLNAEVLQLEEHGDAVDLHWRDETGAHTETYAGVVVATDAWQAAAMHQGLAAQRRDLLADKVRYTWSTVVHVALDCRPEVKSCFIFPGVRAFPNLLIVSLEHNRTPWQAPAGKALVGLYPTSDYARGLFEQDDAAVAAQLIAQARSLIPELDEHVLFTQVSRWHPTLLQSWPGYWTAMREFRQRSEQEDQRIQLAGDYFCTSSLNTASASGERAAARMLDSVQDLARAGP